MDMSRRNFSLESYKQLRAEMGVLNARIENLFRYSLLATSTVFAWVLTQAFGVTERAAICLKLPKEALTIAWWIPTAFIVLSGVITLATHIRVLQMGDFLKECENFMGEPGLSWEVFLATKPPLFTVTTSIAWMLMLAAAIYAATVGLSLTSLGFCSAAK